MDNQQESSRLIDLGWLGGIIDGEGTITIRKHTRKNNALLLTPIVTMTNTDLLITNNYIRILESIDVPFWITNYKGTDRWKAKIRIETTGLRRCKKILPILIPFLVGKKELGVLVNSWCDRRLSLIGKNDYYSEYDIEIFNKVKSFHGHQDEVNYI
jgi:hypothetical protein